MENCFSGKYEYSGKNAKLGDLAEIIENMLSEPESGGSTLDGFVRYYTRIKQDRFQYSGETRQEKEEKLKTRLKFELGFLAQEMRKNQGNEEKFDYMGAFIQYGGARIHELLFAKLGIPDPFRGKEVTEIKKIVQEYNGRTVSILEGNDVFVTTSKARRRTGSFIKNMSMAASA